MSRIGPPKRHDRVSGSLGIFDAAVLDIRSHLEKLGASGLEDLLCDIVSEQPSMALGLNLAALVRDTLPLGRTATIEALELFCTSVTDSRVTVAADFARLVEERRWTSVATYSRSMQVLECLATATMAGLKRVLISEGRPSFESVTMAKELRGEGLVVSLVADAALPSLLSTAGALVVGSDACFETCFANKVGTAFLMREARAIDLQTVVLSIPQKTLAPEKAAAWVNCPLPVPADLKKLPKGVSWVGDLFEKIPWGLADITLGR